MIATEFYTTGIIDTVYGQLLLPCVVNVTLCTSQTLLT